MIYLSMAKIKFKTYGNANHGQWNDSFTFVKVYSLSPFTLFYNGFLKEAKGKLLFFYLMTSLLQTNY